jgi:hypothetical protein
LTVEEFRACAGVGHYCANHLPEAETGRGPKRAKTTRRKAQTSTRGRSITPSGTAAYPCKGQFASDGVIRRGKLTADHPASLGGEAVFVWKDTGYGPGEVVTLFITDPKGRELAWAAGFACHA